MKEEDVQNIKCDRCGTRIGLYHLGSDLDGWRCPSCIWKERKHLIELSKRILDSLELPTCGDGTTLTVYSSDTTALEDYIREIEHQEG